MADLQEALAARERRSRFTAIAISLVIILIVGFIIFRIANNDSSSDVDNGDQTTELTENAENNQNEVDNAEETDSGVDLDELFGVEGTDEDASDTTNGAEDEESAPAVTTAQASGNDDLPNTGPAENAIAGILVLGLLLAVHRNNKLKLAEAQLN